MELLLTLIGACVIALALLWARSRFADFPVQRPADYAGATPEFDIRETLNGPMDCEGVIFGPTGRVVSRFTARMEGRWEGNEGTLSESFRYDSGSTQERSWRLTLGEDGLIRARAADVIGDGAGAQSGNAVQLRYRIRLPDSAGGHVLDTVDWMYLVADGAIINRSQFRKFGVKVAELVATVRKAQN